MANSRSVTKHRNPDGSLVRVGRGPGSPAGDSPALTWSTNDLSFDDDHTTAAIVYKCSAGGTPGTWTELDGGTGTPGLNAFTTTTASFTMPAVGSSVSVAVAQSTFMAVAQVLFVFGAGYFQVASIPDSTHASLTNLGYAGNASPAATIATSAKVSPGGLIGPQGIQGIQGVPGSPGVGVLGTVQFGVFIPTLGTGSGQWIGSGINDVSNAPLPYAIADAMGRGASVFNCEFFVNVYGSAGLVDVCVTDPLGAILLFTTISGVGGPLQIGPAGLSSAGTHGGIAMMVRPHATGFTSPGALDLRAIIALT